MVVTMDGRPTISSPGRPMPKQEMIDGAWYWVEINGGRVSSVLNNDAVTLLMRFYADEVAFVYDSCYYDPIYVNRYELATLPSWKRNANIPPIS
jgi:hypothetical protein